MSIDLPEPTDQRETVPTSGNSVKQDAERYRWLRREHESYGRSWHVREPNNEVPFGLDAAIDKAMATSSPAET